ncbi:PLP-dependent transferase [Mytilinidion resinicola]|uniref:PLP-dependent transferase n=1 Tax=Mytilinidion resinicola TaxID=574789 RepID=A0A6A6YI31_9PEZI|nr:PLP-dependent transferase [Mytilinidion resinicola]KAF2808218.1 PLP-dependent transferase [Mytilinidion resinicola]
MSARGAFLRRTVPAIQIYGANTGVGKTVVSTLLAKAMKTAYWPAKDVVYLKPVSTGPESDRDDRYVRRYAGIRTKTLFQFDDPVSPHIAARKNGFGAPSDDLVCDSVSKFMHKVAPEKGAIIVETAGGVLSPGPSGTPQADIFRPLRLPVVLVGDHRLGGIATTLSAAESLTLRGYDLVAVVLPTGDLGNHDYLRTSFHKQWRIPVYDIPLISDFDRSVVELRVPQGSESVQLDVKLNAYYKAISKSHMPDLVKNIWSNHSRYLHDLDEMPARAAESIWHPFTQHKDRNAAELLPLDSAHGDFFQVYRPSPKPEDKSDSSQAVAKVVPPEPNNSSLQSAFDGSASWWTQGLGHGNRDLALAAAYAAGRYGHVMFAGAVHEPALTLATRLIHLMDSDKKSRLRKVFFTDDGSTGIEVGIKMALKAASVRYGWDGSSTDIGIIGLKGSYHGDTIGAMDCSEPSTYNKKVEWYRGRGYWFDYPQVKMKKGKWTVEAPAGMEDDFGSLQHYESLQEVFDLNNRDASVYERYITEVLKRLIQDEGLKFGALVMEPVLLGAGGMIMVDPLFQQTLARVIRTSPILASMSEDPPSETDSATKSPLDWTGLPVVFDEVFTGMYRLGRFSSSSFLNTQADISVHAKLLTGGLLPLCVTLASQSIFDAFLSDEKSDALLHGHSYTAHAVGCHVANVSMTKFTDLHRSENWFRAALDWAPTAGAESGRPWQHATHVWSMWSKKFVADLSNKECVEGVVAIGSVLAITLVDESGSGYNSNAAIKLRDALLERGPSNRLGIHSRVLGNVFYLMGSLTSTSHTLNEVESAVAQHIDPTTGSHKTDVDIGDDQ